MQDQKDDPVPNQVHTYSTQLGTQILPAIGQCMALVLHLVDPEMVPDWVHILFTRSGTQYEHLIRYTNIAPNWALYGIGSALSRLRDSTQLSAPFMYPIR